MRGEGIFGLLFEVHNIYNVIHTIEINLHLNFRHCILLNILRPVDVSVIPILPIIGSLDLCSFFVKIRKLRIFIEKDFIKGKGSKEPEMWLK